jgi:hypothetical protein
MCLIEDFWLYTKEAAQMKNRKGDFRRQGGKLSRCDFMYTTTAVIMDAYYICDDF